MTSPVARNASTAGAGTAPGASAALRRPISENSTYPRYAWWIILGIIGAIHVVYAIHLAVRSIRKHRRLMKALDDSSAEKLPNGEHVSRNAHGRVVWSRLPLAILNTYRIVAFRCTVPLGPNTVATLADVCFTVGYVALLLLCTFVNTNNLSVSFWANRSATIASAQVPLLPVLAAKNNIITLLTGIPHEKQNILHRAVARTLLLLFTVHGVARGVIGLKGGDSLREVWVQLGVVSLVALGLCTIISLRPIRNRMFEFFLISHNTLIIIFMITGFYHIQITRHQGYWVWPGMVLWAFDRTLRFLRVVIYNRVWRPRANTCKAQVEAVSPDTVRVTLQRNMRWRPGQHAYLTLPGISKLPFEAHPFTIASVPNPPAQETANQNAPQELVFIIRGRHGFTALLLEAAYESHEVTVNAFVDGPYGAPPDLSSFHTSVLIAGGSGVSYTLPLLQDLVQQSRKGSTTVQRVDFIWIIREESHLSWIVEQLAAAVALAPASLEVRVQIYVTVPPLSVTSADATPLSSPVPSRAGSPVSFNKKQRTMSMADSQKTLLISYPGVNIHYGRPDIWALLNVSVDSATGPVSVGVSGPTNLVKSVRNALRSSEIAGPGGVLRGRPSVSLHVESFGM